MSQSTNKISLIASIARETLKKSAILCGNVFILVLLETCDFRAIFSNDFMIKNRSLFVASLCDIPCRFIAIFISLCGAL